MKLLKQTSGSFPSSYSYRVVLLLLVETVTMASDLMDTTQSHVLARELVAKFAFFFYSWTNSLNTARGQKDHNLKVMSCSNTAKNPAGRPEFILQAMRHVKKQTNKQHTC